MKPLQPLRTSTIALALALGCAPALEPSSEAGGGHETDAQTMEVGPDIDLEDLGNGDFQTVIDATDATLWVYFDIDAGLQVTSDAPETDTEWDLGFQRFQIKLNGGVSGSGDVEVATTTEAYENVTEAPANGFETDLPDGDDDNEDPDYALSSWYDYDPATHVLTPKSATYVLKSSDGAYFRLAMTSYYDAAGNSGHMSFRWSSL